MRFLLFGFLSAKQEGERPEKVFKNQIFAPEHEAEP